jgi:hypothetical protein
MSAKRKSVESRHRKDRREAEKYLWHLSLAWREKFDHDSWWNKNPANVKPEAVVWEILRRHPQTEKFVAGESLTAMSPKTSFFVSSFAVKSWAKLDEPLQRRWSEWLNELPPQHGVLFKDVKVIGDTSDWHIEEIEKMRSLTKQFNDSITGTQPIAWDKWIRAQIIWDTTAPHGQAAGGGPSWNAFECLSGGCVLVGFDPNDPGIEKTVQKRVKEIVTAARQHPAAQAVDGRYRGRDWLDIISRFEQPELARKKGESPRDDQIFACYRRVISKWEWPS